MSAPILYRWEDNAGRNRIGLRRNTHNVHRSDGTTWSRTSGVQIWPEEQTAIENAILADLGLMTIAEHKRILAAALGTEPEGDTNA